MNDDDIAERVARAAFERYHELFDVGLERPVHTRWGDLPPWSKSQYVEAQRAGIAALRQPTEAMLKAGGAVSQKDGDFNDVCAKSCWRAMIDTALTPPTNF